jgi:two-component system, chemotaxis family, protein-glutamate methylesterase/glutaminase
MSHAKIKVLVVEDSPVARELLLHILGSDARLEVVGTAHNGAEAVAAVRRWKPDVITMDVQMPGLDGYEATRAIMETAPVPVIVVSSHVDHDEVATTFRAIEAGAVMALRKPAGPGHPEYERLAAELVTAVRLMSEVKVVRRTSRLRRELGPELSGEPGAAGAAARHSTSARRELRAVGVGASTGGPLVLQQIFQALPADFPAPIFVVQHMAEGFVGGLAEWLDQSSALTVRVAADDETALPGHVYLAPDNCHLKVTPGGRIALSGERTADGFRPSVSYLFRSLAAAYGPHAAGVLLTGMGDDGASGLLAMRERGALTIAQDERSSVVFGMPQEAIRLGAVGQIISPDRIPAALLAAAARP